MAGDDVADLGHVDERVERDHELVARQPEHDLDALGPQAGVQARRHRVSGTAWCHLHIVSGWFGSTRRAPMPTAGELDVRATGRRPRCARSYGVDLAPASTTTPSPPCTRAFLEHMVVCIRGQAAMTPEDQLAFAARWGEISIHPYVPSIDGYPGIMRIYDPNPVTVTWHADTTHAPKPPGADAPAGPGAAARRWRHDVLQRRARLRQPVRRACGRRSTACGPSTRARSWRPSAGLDRAAVTTRAPGRAHPPRDRPAGAVRQRQLHVTLRRAGRRRRAARCSSTSTRRSAGPSTPTATIGRWATSSSGTTAAPSTPWSATPAARSARCTG